MKDTQIFSKIHFQQYQLLLDTKEEDLSKENEYNRNEDFVQDHWKAVSPGFCALHEP